MLLDIRGISSFTDYFIICSGDNPKQIQAIYDEIEQVLKKAGVIPLHREGTLDSGWMVLDYGDMVVHVFSPEEREYYQLEKLWANAKPLLRMQ